MVIMGIPPNSKKVRKQKMKYLPKIKTKKDRQKLKNPEPYQMHIKKYEKYSVEMDTEVNLVPAKNVIDYIYQNDIRSRSVFSMPEDVRKGLQESSVAALLWRFGRKNRWKKQPNPHMIVYGRYVTPDYVSRRIEICREGLSIPMPLELRRDDNIRWVQFDEKVVTVTIKLPQQEDAPFNINQIPNLGMPPDNDGDGEE